MTLLVSLICSALVATTEPDQEPKADDLAALEALGKVQVILKTNDDDRVITFLCAGCKRPQPTQADLAHLKGLPHLETINLQALKGLTDEGMASVGQATSVTVLFLPLNCDVTDAGIKHVLALENLKTLNLRSGDVTDAGVEQLVQLEKLEHLSLNSIYVTDAALVHLAQMKQLKTLDLGWSTLSDDKLNDLVGKLPNTMVKYRLNRIRFQSERAP